MNQGDIIKIRNKAGLLKLQLRNKLNPKDVQKGLGEDKLGSFTCCRWEFHKNRSGDFISTLYDHIPDNEKIFVAITNEYDNDNMVEFWEADIKESEREDGSYETCGV